MVSNARGLSTLEFVKPNGKRVKHAAQLAYDHLIDQLLSGRYKPGDWIDISELAAILGVSRTPVMEAVKRLEQEGFIEILPRVGCRVAKPSVREMQEVFRVRLVLEGQAAAEAALRARSDHLEVLYELVRAGHEAVESGDASRFAAVNLAFHQALAVASGMERLAAILRQFWLASRYYLVSVPYFEEHMERSAREHALIVEAIALGWPEVAREATVAHLNRCITAFRSYLPDQESEERTRGNLSELLDQLTQLAPWIRMVKPND